MVNAVCVPLFTRVGLLMRDSNIRLSLSSSGFLVARCGAGLGHWTDFSTRIIFRIVAIIFTMAMRYFESVIEKDRGTVMYSCASMSTLDVPKHRVRWCVRV
jgi:hypothetical protein